jgi:LPXTG-site transpeptidase (sortase) family protein
MHMPRISTIVSTVFIAAGLYIVLLASSPMLHEPAPGKAWNVPVNHQPKAQLLEDRIYIPKLQLNITYKAGDKSVLSDNAWWRQPAHGNPKDGGNFILAAHRFEMGLTPGETRYKSPFYHLDALTIGDKIYADYKGVRYMYEVYDRYKVTPNDTSIEGPTDDARMTLYSCTFRGSADGREVVFARRTEIGVDPTIAF